MAVRRAETASPYLLSRRAETALPYLFEPARWDSAALPI